MTDNSINAFLRVAEKGGIAEAARDDYMSPQSFWKYIATLEKELQIKLFSRDGRTLKLSPAGRLWYDYFKSRQESRETLIASLRADAELSAEETTLSVGIAQNVWMRPEITRAIQDYNSAEDVCPMKIHIATAPVLADMLDLDEISAAVTLGYPATTRPASEERLQTSEYMILASPEHPLAQRNASMEELAEEEFLIGLDGEGYSPLEARVLFSGNFRRVTGLTPHVRVLRNTASAVNEVRLGNGFMFINGFDQQAMSPSFAKIRVGGESSLVFRWKKERRDTELLLSLLRQEYGREEKQ